MLRHESSARLLSMFAECLCFFAALRANMVGRLLRSDKKGACKESRTQTQDVHVETGCLRVLAQFEWLYQAFLVHPAAFRDAFLWCSIVIPTGPFTVSTLKVKFSFLELQAVHNTESAAHVNIAHRLVFFGIWAAELKALLEELVAHEARTVERKKQLYALRNRITSEVNAVASEELVQERETCLRWTLEKALHRPATCDVVCGSALLHGFRAGANRHVAQPRTWARAVAEAA